ncbi:MAG: PH domain-containing protein [Eggerthellaceae bacterium]
MPAELVAGVLPEFADMPQETVKPAPVALRRAIVRKAVLRSSVFWLVVGHPLPHRFRGGFACANLFSVEPAVFAVARRPSPRAWRCSWSRSCSTADAVLWHRMSGLGYDRAFMSVTNGGLSKQTVVFPRKKIQYGFVSTNPFQRAAHAAIVNARTASGVGGTTEQLWDVSAEDADRWMEWVRLRSRREGSRRNGGRYRPVTVPNRHKVRSEYIFLLELHAPFRFPHFLPFRNARVRVGRDG